ncbi:MAG: asparagine synthase (glutamine-hydrolyzing) [Poseidonia sp.]
MCGIGGMLGAPDANVLHRMNRLQHHRGPDADDVWMDERVGFAHARLAIVDLESSQQPMHGASGTALIVNGEIYNHLELRRQRSTYPFTTRGDSEAILALHEYHVNSAPQRPSPQDHARWIASLDGMYAFALWDPSHQQLLLARDPLGIKPLLRTSTPDSLLFASEAKAFRAHEAHVPRLDELALAARLVWEYPLDGTTMLQGVHQVRPGTVECWTLNEHGQPVLEGVANIERQALCPENQWHPETGAASLLETFIVSVQQRLMADVPVGIVLSGGLDSSLVCAVADEAAKRAGQPVPECWTVAESEDNPDWQAAERVASELDLVHHQHLLEADAFDHRLPRLAWHGEDADVTVMFFHPLFEHMAKRVKVGLCGQGADELHAGYPRYGDLPQHGALLSHRMSALPDALGSALLDGSLSQDEGWYEAKHDPTTITSDLQSMLNFELEHGQLSNFQLRLVDRHSMAHSLEVRVPFLGTSHRQAANRLPLAWKRDADREEKAALRQAADLTRLPKDIVRRPKLPAGRATSPSMLEEFLAGRSSQIQELLDRYRRWAPVLKGQEELALGLGLFEALHLAPDGHTKHHQNIDQLLTGVISP